MKRVMLSLIFLLLLSPVAHSQDIEKICAKYAREFVENSETILNLENRFETLGRTSESEQKALEITAALNHGYDLLKEMRLTYYCPSKNLLTDLVQKRPALRSVGLSPDGNHDLGLYCSVFEPIYEWHAYRAHEMREEFKNEKMMHASYMARFLELKRYVCTPEREI